MKQVKNRAAFVLVLTLLLFGGTVLFCVRYMTQGDSWAAFSANQHAYKDGAIAAGTIYDRNGTLLFDSATSSYHEESLIRKSTLHAVGDREKNIATSALSVFSRHLAGFSPVTGTTTGGHDLYLSIDAQLNAKAYKLLDGRKGTVGIYNYKTGEVVCMVSAPAFDPANPPEIKEGSTKYEGVYLNRLLSSTFTPGSIFKIVTTAAAIENIDDLFTRSFTCSGSITIGSDTITCPHAHGDMDIYGAFANSCNGVYAQLATELGGEVLAEYAEKCGLLSSYDISGISTAAGSFDIAEGSDLGWSGVGQYHDAVNPCSMMVFMGTVANGGSAKLPLLIEKETTSSGIPAGVHRASSVSCRLADETCALLVEMMANNVASQYGQENFGDLLICAKSGTAEVGSDAAPHSWFTGFLNDPQNPYAFVVLVENGGSGSKVAGSIASTLLQMLTAAE